MFLRVTTVIYSLHSVENATTRQRDVKRFERRLVARTASNRGVSGRCRHLGRSWPTAFRFVDAQRVLLPRWMNVSDGLNLLDFGFGKVVHVQKL